MFRHRLMSLALLASALMMIVGLSLVVPAQERPSATALIAAQRDAMLRLAYMDGVWRGPAWTILPSGEKHTFTQTERIGPFLDGSVKVIEGRDMIQMAKSPSMLSGPFRSTRRQKSTCCTLMRWATLAISCWPLHPMATHGTSLPGR